MTTKTLDTTVSKLLQDNSSVECVDVQKNPIATIQTEPKNLASVTTLFDFNAEHNGVQCIESLKPEDRGTERQYWFSVKFLYEAFEVTDKTIRNKLERLEKLGEISNCNFLQLLLPDTCKPSTLYDLTVMNKLAMTLDCDKAVEVRKAFNDVLIKHETQTQPTIYDYARALIAEKERSDALEAQNKALTAERDEAIRTKAMIGSKREATAMATASAKSKECARLTTENELLTTENGRLRQDYVENKDFCKQLLAQKLVVYVEKTLRDKCSKALQELSYLMEIPRLEWKEFSEHAGKEVPRYAYHKDVCAELKQRIIDNPKYLKRFK